MQIAAVAKSKATKMHENEVKPFAPITKVFATAARRNTATTKSRISKVANCLVRLLLILGPTIKIELEGQKLLPRQR